MFEQLTDKLEGVFKKLSGQGKLTEANVSDALREVRVALLSADVNFKTAKEFIAKVKEEALGREVLTAVSPGQLMVKVIYDQMVELLGGDLREPLYQGSPPVQIVLMGLQGSGKTTACGKLALYLRNQKKKNPLMVACDVYRPAAIKQLQTVGKQLGIPVFEEGEGDPVQIALNGKRFARDNGHDLVIYDTAGRTQIDDALMAELEKICAEVKPTEKFFVADAMTGQEAVNVAKTFDERLDFTGVILTKMDGDSRGGAALSIKHISGKPIHYVGVGEKMDAFELFHPDRMASRILGMGDVLTLVEKAQAVVDEKQAKQFEKKFRQNKFDLDDFLQQLRQIKKMGSMTEILGMIPGLNKLSTGDINEKELVHVEAILSSMTVYERKTPKIIDGSRRKRVAMGSGTSVQQVNKVLKQFEQMQKMMKQFMGKPGKMREMARMMQQGGGMPGM